MPTKYLAYRSSLFPPIEKIKITRETDKSVFIRSKHGNNEIRSLKQSSFENYFDTWDEAYQFVLKNATDKVNMKKSALKHAEAYLKKIIELKHPKD